jgi:hypothetical protein
MAASIWGQFRGARAYRARIIERVCHIEEYRQSALAQAWQVPRMRYTNGFTSLRPIF